MSRFAGGGVAASVTSLTLGVSFTLTARRASKAKRKAKANVRSYVYRIAGLGGRRSALVIYLGKRNVFSVTHLKFGFGVLLYSY